MTRSERVRAACERFAEGPPVHLPGETVDEGIEAALDAALADLGGLAGLDELNRSLALARDAWEPYPHDTPAEMTEGLAAAVRYWRAVFEVACDERDALRADRDRLRDALRDVLRTRNPLVFRQARAALDESEAGT